jgi:ubiquinone/menaquinone biosynthesis C-methylase UbiE
MSVAFDRAVGFYDQTRGLPPHIEQWLVHATHNEIGLAPSSRMLEAGVGTGRIALPFAKQGYRYTGVDLSRQMMATLRSKARGLPINLVQADIAGLPFADHAFDAVVAVHIFHLVSEWAAAMDEIRRVLRPGGVLLHGHNRRADDHSLLHQLREHMTQRATELQPQREQRLAWSEVNQQLRERFGTPQKYSSPTWRTTQTSRTVIDQFANRIWSSTWHLRDDVLVEAVAAGEAWARERWGDLHTPFTDEQRFAWQVYRRDA